MREKVLTSSVIVITAFALLAAAVAALVFFGASFFRPGVLTSSMIGLRER